MPTTYFVSTTGLSSNDGLSAGAPKPLSDVLGLASNGDTISLADGTYARLDVSGKTLNFVATTTPTAKTVPGFSSGHPALLNRGVIINEATLSNAPDCTFTNLWFKWNKWVDTTNHETFESVYGVSPPDGIVTVNSGGHAPIFTACEFSWGYGSSQAAFDPTVKYPEFQSGAYAVTNGGSGTITGWGDTYQTWWTLDNTITGSAPPANTSTPNGRAYNTIMKAPPAVHMAHASLRSAQYYACHFHDLRGAIHYYCDKAPLVVDQCWFERIYLDIMSGGMTAEGLGTTYGLQVTRCIAEQPFALSADSGNPHSDFLQNFSNYLIADPASPMRFGGVRIERNFALIRNTDRGHFQNIFLQGAAGHDTDTKGVVYWNPIVRDNASLQRESDKGVLVTATHDGLIEYNALLPHPASTSSSPATRIQLWENPYTKLSGVPLVQHNIVENGTLLPTAHGVDNVAVGSDYDVIGATTVMQGPFNLTGTSDTAADWFDSMARQTAYAAKGPRYATLENLVTDALTVADMPLFVGFADQRECAIDSDVDSDVSVIRGPLGDTVTVSVDKGAFQIEDINGAVLNSWRDHSLSPLAGVAVGSALRLRQRTSSSYTTPTVQTATITHATLGSATFTFNASTLSNVVLPTVSLPTTGSLTNGSGGATMGTGSAAHRFTFAARFTPTASVASSSTYMLYGHISGANQPVWIRILSSGKIRITAKTSTGVALIGSWESSTTIQLNHEYLLIVSCDLAGGAGACSAKAWDLTDGTSHLTWGTPTVVDGVLAFDTTHRADISYGATNGCAPKVNFVYLDNTLNIDANTSEAFLRFSNAYLGANGEGPTGSAPLVFVAGPASDWTASGGINRGTGCKFTAVGSGIVDVESPVRPYPPVLDLHATPQETGPYPANDPLDLLVQPTGYGLACNVTPSSDKAGTWSASPLSVPAGEAGAIVTFTPTQTGTHTITFTNNVGYNNPASQTIDVV